MTGRVRTLEEIENQERARAQHKPDFLDGQIARRTGLPGRVDLTAGKPPRQIEWLVEGRIPMRQTTILAGPGGDGKSFAALQLAVACAAGATWFGLDVRHCPAVVYACEDDDAILYHRTQRIAEHHGFEIADLEDLMVCSGVGADNELVKFGRFDPKGEPTDLLARIENAATQANAGLLVLDSLHDLFLGNEIDRAQARSFVRHLTAVAQSAECAILLIAHPSRSGIREGSGQSGSTAWFNSVRSFLHVKREPRSPIRTIEHTKNQYGPLADNLAFEWSDEHSVFVPCNAAPMPERSGKLRSARQQLGYKRLVDWFNDRPDTDSMSSKEFAALMIERGVIEPGRRAAITELRQQLETRGFITFKNDRISLIHQLF
jgi:RecA/RadA recombinase